MIKTLQTILRQDRERFIIPKEVQEIIPVNRIWSDGIFKSGNPATYTPKHSNFPTSTMPCFQKRIRKRCS